MTWRRRWTVLVSGLGLLASLVVGGTTGRAGVVTGNPGGSLAGQIPVSAAVDPYATLAWTDCLYGLLAPLSGGGCNSTLNVASNTDISLRLVATPLTNGAGRRMLSSYTVTPSGGSALTLNPDTGQTAQVFQVGAPLDTLRAYAIHGTATNDQASTVAGSYTGQIQVTLVAAAADLTAPTGVAVTPGDTQLTVTWNAVPGATGYEVGYHLGTTWNASAATVVSATGTSKVLTGLTNGQAYMVAVRSVFGSTKSGWSAAVQGAPASPLQRFYRDARDFQNIVTYSTGNQKWSWTDTNYPNGSISHGQATGIVHRVSSSASLNIPTSTFSVLPAGTYNVWLYLNVNTFGTACPNPYGLKAKITNGATTLEPSNQCFSGGAGVFAWTKIGAMAINPATSVTVTMRSEGASNDWVVIRGVYLTQGTETPTTIKSGQSGDSTQVQ